MLLPQVRLSKMGSKTQEPLDLYSEFEHLGLYYDFVVYVSLACPQLLYTATLQGLMTVVTTFRAVLVIYRDIVSTGSPPSSHYS